MDLTTNKMLEVASDHTPIPFFLNQLTTVATAPTIQSGYTPFRRHPDAFVMPSSLPAGINGWFLTQAASTANINQAAIFFVLEYDLGTLTIGATRPADVFTAGVSMPTKVIQGESVQTAAALAVLRVTTAPNATTPTWTTTYTNQDGTGSRTCAITTLSNPALNSAYILGPHLQSGDTGIRSVQNIVPSVGTSGVVKVSGLLPLHIDVASVGSPSNVEPLHILLPHILAEINETVAFYTTQTSNATGATISGTFLGDLA